MEDLQNKTVRGGALRLIGQLACLALRLGTIIVLARLLDPFEFGIVAMVTALTGMLEILSNGGLSSAAIQQHGMTDHEFSALYWVNIAIGLALALICLLLAPLVGRFYHEPRAGYVLAAMAPAFIFNATGIQHMALMHRQLRYAELTAIEVAAQLAGALVSVALALVGMSYWAVAASVVAPQALSTMGYRLCSGWRPGAPRAIAEVSGLLRFGGTITLNNLVVYVAYNIEKILLGRYFGGDVLGYYSRAYQLINLPTFAINASVGGVAFSSLSRLQNEPARFKTLFLKGYELTLTITVPITLACSILADDVILVVLGPKWAEAAAIFRLLAPTILVFSIINPLGWLMQSIGQQRRSLNIALALAPVVIVSYLVGIPYGARGVALAYSIAMCLWLVPHVFWCLKGTPVSVRELCGAVARPLSAAIPAAVVCWLAQTQAAGLANPYVRLALGGSAMVLTYALVLLYVFKQGPLYFDLARKLRSASSA